MKSRVVLLVAGLLGVGAAVGWLRRPVQEPATSGAPSAAASLPVVPSALASSASTNAAAPVAAGRPEANREFDRAVNPYASALKQPGRSKRAWDAGYIETLQDASAGTPVAFELTGGRMARGTVQTKTLRDGAISYVSGVLTEPEKGSFFFIKPPEIGKAGQAVGIVEFHGSQTAFRIEPTGLGGEPELWERRMDEVMCLNFAARFAAAVATRETNAVAIPPLRPDLVPNPVPSYNSNVVSLQSLPGAKGVLLLDFFGGYTASWGGVNYVRPAAANNSTIREVWKRVAEDYMPFNINVTTDVAVYLAAPETSRQRCAFTDTPVTAAGVAYFGSWNWGGDVPCWSVYTTGKSAAEVASHEVGHTLGLSHMGSTTLNDKGEPIEYEDGHGSGATGWTPIMGVGYYQNVATWTKGEYENANNTQDELTVIVSDNNNVDYRADDTGGVLGNSRHLEIHPDFSVFAEGVIERTADADAFQFTTTGGAVSLTAKPVGDWANLAVMATLLNGSGSVIASNNPQNKLSATIATNLPAGTYALRVTGAGRGDPYSDGFTAYGSLGYYSIQGFVQNGRLPERFVVMEKPTNGTFVGQIPLLPGFGEGRFGLVAGNSNAAFRLSLDGALSVNNGSAIDYDRLASNATRAVEYQLFVNVTNPANASLNERNRRVVVSVRKAGGSYPVAVSGFNADLVVAYDATPAAPGASGFDVANNYAFYQTGLDGNAQVGGSGGEDGLPADGFVPSQANGALFRIDYRATNALLLGGGKPTSGRLTLATPEAYNSLSVLASSANGGGQGNVSVTFTDGTVAAFRFNAQDWFGTRTNVGFQGVGRLRLGQAAFNTEDPGWDNPNLYHTTLDLASRGLNKKIASLTFTKPAVGGNHNSAVFGLSGEVMPPGAAISVPPVSVTNDLPGIPVSFSVLAMGTGPLAYQWHFRPGNAGASAPLAHQTNATLSLPAEVSPSAAGGYFVVVTNAFGSVTSSVATLTVLRAPQITLEPGVTDLILYSGRRLSLTADGTGAKPLQYRWTRDGVGLVGAGNTNYAIASLLTNHAGRYALTLSNAYGMATSRVVTLAVPPAPLNHPFPASILSDQPLGYWRLDETAGSVAHDYAGGRNGVYSNTVLNQLGYNAADPNRAARFGPNNNSMVAGIPVDFATSSNAAFTVEAWVKGSAQTTDAGIVTKGAGAGGEQFNLDTGAPGRRFRFFVRDAGGGARLANGSVGPDGNWHHLVGVVDQARSNVLLYIDGALNASATIEPGSGLLSSGNAMTIGSRQSGTGAYNNQFNGTIDEVAVYARALSATEIAERFAVRNQLPPRFLRDPFTLADARVATAYTASLVGTVTEPNGQAVTYARVSGPAWLGVAAGGAVTGTPLATDAGTNRFVVRATDAGGLATDASLAIVVVAPSPLSTRLIRQEGGWLLDWSGGLGPFQIEMATNLVSPVWLPYGGSTSGTNMVLAPTNPAAFFRILGQ